MKTLHRRLVPVLVVCMSLAVRIPAASAQVLAAPIWSIQLHGGMFAPIQGGGASPMLGVRYCKHYTPHVYAGMLSGYTRMSRSVDQPVQDPTDPGLRVAVGQVDAQLVPLMGFIQLNLSNRFLVPLIGAGVGYEWLKAEVKDFRTGTDYQPSYGNIAWETYGGIALRLTSKVRLNGELFYNGGALQRSVLDANGQTWYEVVHMNGVGLRAGLDMDFE